MKMKNFFTLASLALVLIATGCSGAGDIQVVDRPLTTSYNSNYISNKAPLKPQHFIKLPVGSVQPGGWVKRMLELERDGLAGHLAEISPWLIKEGNAWLSDGGNHGWEEVPYWLKGYGDMAYIFNDEKMLEETKVWVEGALASVHEDGAFGPRNFYRGNPEVWAHMIMLWCLQSYYDYSGDERVIDLMTKYFQWEISLPDESFLTHYWERSRAGDNLLSVYWLYNHTGDAFLLELAEKIHRNAAVWYDPAKIANWHNVNIAQGFREPATYYMLSGDEKMLQATYNTHDFVRRCFGQVPGGMFGADENARIGYIDPRQGVETCGLVEQMASDEILLCLTGDPFWAEHCEDVTFNSFPASMTPDLKALRYFTSPNMAISDTVNHSPSIQNNGPFLAMNPFSSRCCQHNHAQGWPYYSEHLVLATPDDGVAIALYAECEASMKVGQGIDLAIVERTHYPFDENISFEINPSQQTTFPFYIRIPSWTSNPVVKVNGKKVATSSSEGKYVRIERKWKAGDKVTVSFPMSMYSRTWQVNQGSVSVNYGPLTLSLKIEEKEEHHDSAATAIIDSQWREDADGSRWPTTAYYPASKWNMSLVLDKNTGLPKNYKIEKLPWPEDDYPFTTSAVPLRVKALGREIPSWGFDETGLTAVLPPVNAPKEQIEPIELVPMGAARLRISAFPNTKE